MNKIADHLNLFYTLICQLNSMDVKLNDKDNAIALLCSLPKSWDHFFMSIKFITTKTLEFDSFVKLLLSEEVRSKSSIETSTPKAMVARGQSKEKEKKVKRYIQIKVERQEEKS